MLPPAKREGKQAEPVRLGPSAVRTAGEFQVAPRNQRRPDRQSPTAQQRAAGRKLPIRLGFSTADSAHPSASRRDPQNAAFRAWLSVNRGSRRGCRRFPLRESVAACRGSRASRSLGNLTQNVTV